MLQQLHIENYALIDRLDVEFHPGLNLLTGETGSGKSIVVEALGLLLGEKGSSDLIRSGAERARIAGVFSFEGANRSSSRRAKADDRKRAVDAVLSASSSRRTEVRTLLEESGIGITDGDELILQRDLMPLGRSRIFINNQPATVGLLKALAPLLAEVHGQNEQQELFEAKAQLEALDRFGGLSDQLEIVRDRFETWNKLRRKLEQWNEENKQLSQQRDSLEFQKREIEQAGIVEGEEERLEEEKRMLSHAERTEQRLASCYELLYDAPNSAVASLGTGRRQLEDIATFDTSLQPLIETLEAAKSSVEDLALALRDRLAKLESSPGRLEVVENRLAQLDRLKRKYSLPLSDILNHWRQVCARIDQLDSGEATVQEIEDELAEAANAYESAAKSLSSKRAKAARELKRAVEKELAELAMSGTVFEVNVDTATAIAEWRSSGVDSIKFLLSPNPGEPLRPLSRVASGGESSRIMLALETVIACRPKKEDNRRYPDHALIFDEVDAGIGGRAAETVGRKLRKLGEDRQVLCVTHLPQIASFAHHHYRVEKTVQDGRTTTRITYLQDKDRRAELARMLSGSQVSPAVLAHAGQLLKANAR
jgi:DNA repair protein RecN (Recombination protein N)